MDTQSLIAYSKVHEYLLGRLPRSNSYNDRIIAQKIGFMIHEQGIYLGDLNFYWHRRGPYSRILAAALRYYKANEEQMVEACSKVKLYEHARTTLQRVKQLIEQKPHDCTELIWLEICASLKFLSKVLKTSDPRILSEALIRKKSFMSDYRDVIDYAWNSIIRLDKDNKRILSV